MFVTDHDFQTAVTEALCRVIPPDQRKEVADRLFQMEHVAGAFVKLRDSEFETVNYFPNSSIQSKLASTVDFITYKTLYLYTKV